MSDHHLSTPTPLRRHSSSASDDGIFLLPRAPSAEAAINDNEVHHLIDDLAPTRSFPAALGTTTTKSTRRSRSSSRPENMSVFSKLGSNLSNLSTLKPRRKSSFSPRSIISEDHPVYLDARDDSEEDVFDFDGQQQEQDHHDDEQGQEHQLESSSSSRVPPDVTPTDDDSSSQQSSHYSHSYNNHHNMRNDVLICDQLSIDILRSPTALSVMSANSAYSAYSAAAVASVTSEVTAKAGNRDPNAPPNAVKQQLPSRPLAHHPPHPAISRRSRRSSSRISSKNGSGRVSSSHRHHGRNSRKGRSAVAVSLQEEEEEAVKDGDMNKLLGAFTKIITFQFNNNNSNTSNNNSNNDSSRSTGNDNKNSGNKKGSSNGSSGSSPSRSSVKPTILKHRISRSEANKKDGDGIAPYVFL